MAINFHSGNGSDDRKVSGFSKHAQSARAAEPVVVDADSAGKRSNKALFGKRGNRLWMSIVVDLILLAVLAGLVVGCVFGYRALRNYYAPAWETREVVFTVMMEGISPDMVKYGQDGRPTFSDNPIWSSDRTDADQLGHVTDVRTVLVSTEGENTLTLYLTVEATAYYREGMGYRMGETMLLAGTEGSFRLQGLTADGMIISMHEKKDDTAKPVPMPEDGILTDETVAVDPDAQG